MPTRFNEKGLLTPNQAEKVNNKLHQGSDLPHAYIHPKELSESQEMALRQTSFSYYRYSLQIGLVVKLCARLGLRASEPTMLERQHWDFGNRKIYLTVTKSQKPQELPLLSDLVEPLRLFSRLLPKHNDRLFVKCDGKPWKTNTGSASGCMVGTNSRH
jgi:integrase